MNNGFTKLFGTILTSTVWQESDKTRIVWITMLALADRDGEVAASIPGLANVANVSVEDCVAALEKFKAPDEYSRTKTPECGGRRIEEIPGGFRLLNYAKYREDLRSQGRREYLREKQAESRARKRQQVSTSQPTSTGINQDQPIAEAEAEADNTNTGRCAPAKADNQADSIYKLYPKKKDPKRAKAKIQSALKEKSYEYLKEKVESYALAVSRWRAEELKYVPDPATWFNAGGYDSDPSTWSREPLFQAEKPLEVR